MSDWNLGLDPTPATGTDPDEATNRINFHDHSGVGKGEPIDSQYVINTPAGDITATSTQTAIAQLNVLANLGRIHVPVRQTVLHGLTDTGTGSPVFLQTGSGLAVDLAATSTPLIVAFAYNFDSDYGALDYIGKVTADVTGAWSSLPANQTCYLYVDRNIDTGVLTYGYSLFAPAYRTLPPGTPATDQHWFDLNSFYMKRYSGTAWENKQRVFVGECVTGASTVTSVICYALRGYYDSGWFNVATQNEYTKNHNIKSGDASDINVWGYIRANSGSAMRLINNVNLTDGSVGGGDIVTIYDKSVYIKSSLVLHPIIEGTTYHPGWITTGEARIFAKRGW
jgi:hypothetical protein